MVYCAVKLIENLKLHKVIFLKAINNTFRGFTGVITNLGLEKLVNHEPNCFCVLPTSRVGYHAGKPVESVVYCLNKKPF